MEKQIKLPKFYFSSIVLWLRLTGIEVLNKDEGLLYRIYSAFTITFVWIYVLAECYEINYHNDLDSLTLISWYVVIHVTIMIKVVAIYKNRKDIGELLKSFHEGFYKLNKERGGEFEERCLSRIMQKCDYQTSLYLLSIVGCCAAGAFASLKARLTETSEKWLLPYISMSYVDVRSSPTFEIMYVIQQIATTIICIWLYFCDRAIFCILAQTVAQLKILKHYVRNYSSIGVQVLTEGKTESVGAGMGYTVRYHMSILATVDNVEYQCSFLVLCGFISNLILLCVALYQMSLVPIISVAFVRYSAYNSCVLIQLFMYCWWGNEMTVVNEAFAQEVYESYNPNDPISYNKSLKLILAKAQKPLFITAGKFAPVSLETFKAILKGSFSYFTVLHQVKYK